ncbi:MAG: VanZ family protein [Candidatus Glassbacteria bacterium]
MQSKTRKWLHVGLFSIVILLTLPVGPLIRDFLYERFGMRSVIFFVAAVLTAGFVTALVHAFRKKGGLPLLQLFWFLLVGYLYWIAIKRTFKVPIESIHFVEYGIVSLLMYRALRESFNETYIFLASFLLTYSLGIVDEFIQFLLPNRVGAFRDVLFNAVSGGLVQMLLWRGIMPEGLLKGLPARSFKLVGILASMNCLATGFFISRVSDFGYLIKDPEVGTFFSRLSGEEIMETDSLRWKEYAEALDSSLEVPYSKFLAQTKDPFLYEMRVHIFRRDRHFEDESYRVSCCEEEILRKYFVNTLTHSLYNWDDENTETCEEKDRMCSKYRSPVSQELIVRYDERSMWIVVLLSCGAFLILSSRKSLTSRPE